jgi:hypothetical protein
VGVDKGCLIFTQNSTLGFRNMKEEKAGEGPSITIEYFTLAFRDKKKNKLLKCHFTHTLIHFLPNC